MKTFIPIVWWLLWILAEVLTTHHSPGMFTLFSPNRGKFLTQITLHTEVELGKIRLWEARKTAEAAGQRHGDRHRGLAILGAESWALRTASRRHLHRRTSPQPAQISLISISGELASTQSLLEKCYSGGRVCLKGGTRVRGKQSANKGWKN